MEVPQPKWIKKPLVVPYKTLMGPGPSNSSPRVLHAMSQQILGHMHPEIFKIGKNGPINWAPKSPEVTPLDFSTWGFIKDDVFKTSETVEELKGRKSAACPENPKINRKMIMDEIKEGIQYIFQTRNELTLALSTSGHGGIEAILCNLIEPRDKVLVAVSGIWGERISNMANRYGGVATQIKVELGDNFKLIQLEAFIEKIRPKLVFIVHGESSTGIYQPLEGIGDICRRFGSLLAVDAVASMGTVPLLMDEWKIDALYTCSQKVLSAAPGLTPISFSPRAQKVLFERKTPISIYYLDMSILGQQWNCFDNVRPYHHTVSSTLLYGLREALAIVCEEGLENVISRHQYCAKLLYDGIERLGLQFLVEDFYKRLPSVTTIKVPGNLNWQKVTSFAMDKYSLEISGGLGPTAGKVFRIGLMGYNATPENVQRLLSVLEEALNFAQTSAKSKL